MNINIASFQTPDGPKTELRGIWACESQKDLAGKVLCHLAQAETAADAHM